VLYAFAYVFKMFSLLLKEPMVLKELSALLRELLFFLKAGNIFQFRGREGWEQGGVLANLEFVGSNYSHLQLGKSGVDKVLRLPVPVS